MPCYYKVHYFKLLSSSVVPAVTAYNPELNLDQQFELIVSHSHHSYGSLKELNTTWTTLKWSHHLLCLSYELSTFISETPVKIHVTDPKSFIKHICLAYYHVLLSLKTHHPSNRPLLESFHELVHTFCTLHCHGSLESVHDHLNYLKKLIQGKSTNQLELLPLFYFMKSVTKLSKTTIQRFFFLITSQFNHLILPGDHSVEETFSRLSEFYHLFRQAPIIRDYIKNNISMLKLDPKNMTIRDIISKWIKDVKDSSLLECLHDSGYDLRYYDTSKLVTNHELPPIAISVDNHSYDCLQFFLEVIYEKRSLPMPNQLPLILSAILVLNFNAARAIQKHTPIDFNTFRMDTHHDSLAHKVTTLPFSQDKFMAICIDFLIELNCLSLLNSQNDIGKTPIHILFEENQAIISKTFLSYLLNHTTLQFPLADLSIQDNTGKSPLDSLKSFLPTHLNEKIL